ncbi:O-antigen ligase family protein [Pseudonocardia sp. RS11V-5]|uniref:O-antigen ligase family protein n=1 Tax=Pseudonocardia terrae TaxID=2905831 RepID=UPI001E37AF32|nr:O-antigen ligase family protein [Pseudonocardia terrae]MCE3555017.1 O-antigen ligase family protein [Pseudonocardia terrae]
MIVAAPRTAVADPLVHPATGWDGRAALLGTALGVAVLAQGAFYAGPFTVVAGLVAGAGLLALLHRAHRVPRPLSLGATCWAGFALWALLRAQLDGTVAAAVPTVAVALLLAVALRVAAGLGGEGRRLLQTVAIALVVVVAASGWVGTALHLSPLSMPSAGLWRAAATITYANAAGAALVTGLLLALVAAPAHRPLLRRAVVAALLLGLAVAMSRGAVLALAVGLAVLLATAAGRRSVRGLLPVLPAVALPCAALLPALPEGSPSRPLLALAGLAAGAAVLLAAGRRRRAAGGATVAALLLGLADLVSGSSTGGDPGVAVDAIAETRLSGASADRVDLARETLAHFASAPLTGVGPGSLDLTYVDHAGRLVHAWFTHLEYLQIAAETGLVGLALVLAGAGALVGDALTTRTDRRPPPGAAGAFATRTRRRLPLGATGALEAGAPATRPGHPLAPGAADALVAGAPAPRTDSRLPPADAGAPASGAPATRNGHRPRGGAGALGSGGPATRTGRRLPLGAAGALAVLGAFATQSALDFLWHVPALPLLVCLAVATLLPAPIRTDTHTTKELLG